MIEGTPGAHRTTSLQAKFLSRAQPNGFLVVSMLNAKKESVCTLLDTFVTGEIFFGLSWFALNSDFNFICICPEREMDVYAQTGHVELSARSPRGRDVRLAEALRSPHLLKRNASDRNRNLRLHCGLRGGLKTAAT